MDEIQQMPSDIVCQACEGPLLSLCKVKNSSEYIPQAASLSVALMACETHSTLSALWFSFSEGKCMVKHGHGISSCRPNLTQQMMPSQAACLVPLVP